MQPGTWTWAVVDEQIGSGFKLEKLNFKPFKFDILLISKLEILKSFTFKLFIFKLFNSFKLLELTIL